MLKIGVMGCGAVAAYGHLPAIRETEGLTVSAIFDPDMSRVNLLGAQYPDAWRFTHPDEFFQADMDAVVIASPAPTHASNVRLAAQHKKHVLCEKPLAMTELEAREMVELMHTSGLQLYTGFCYRFSPVAQQIKELVAADAIGKVRSLRLIYLWNLDGKYIQNDQGEQVLNFRRQDRMLEGGPMVDCGVHQIDLARWWLGSEIVRSKGIGAWVEDYEAPDHVYLHLDHLCGAHTMVEMSFTYTSTAREPVSVFSYELIGTDGLIKYDRDGWSLEVRNHNGTRYLPGASEKNFQGMYRAFEEALRTGQGGSLPTGEDGIIATRIAKLATDQAIAERNG